MFNLRFFPFLLLISISNLSFAQEKDKHLESVLWKVQAPNSLKVSYLLGSNHYFGKSWVDSWPKLDSIVNSSDVFICENTIAIDPSRKQQLNTEDLSSGITARSIFGDKFNLVNDYFLKVTGEGIEKNIDTDKFPGIVAYRMMLYLLDEIATKEGLKVSDDGVAMDNVLLLNAYGKKKECVELDNVEVTKKIMFSESFLTSLASGITSMIQYNDTTNVNSKKNADKEELVNFLVNYNAGKYPFELKSKSRLAEKVAQATTRNKLWMKNLSKLIKENNSFTVVGVKHLDGKWGLIKLLRDQGFKVESVNL